MRSSGECGEGLDHVLELEELGGCPAVCILEADLGGLQLVVLDVRDPVRSK